MAEGEPGGGLPVDVLLGTDLYKARVPGSTRVERGLEVLTRSQQRAREQETPPAPDNGNQAVSDAGEQPGSNEEQRGKDGGVEPDVGPPAEGPAESDSGDTNSGETNSGDVNSGVTMTEHGVMEADPEELKQWQQQDPSLVKVRELAGEQTEEPDGRVYFFSREGLLPELEAGRYQCWGRTELRTIGVAPEVPSNCDAPGA